ncbi:MAG: copper chaperone PCu(A)C [Proteobacteria bacterium]|nr:copper chaperone PCu(A)C [Pseudomonadota bacterium]
MSFRCQFLVALVGVAFATPVFAHDYKVGSLEISHPWTRATAPTAKAGGGYVVITNKGATADRLVAAESNASQKVEIHEMKMDGNVMRMRELAGGLEIPPGGSVMLKPGGYHIMFMELKAPLAKGNKVPVTLVFEKAGKVDVDFAVQDMGSAEPMKH